MDKSLIQSCANIIERKADSDVDGERRNATRNALIVQGLSSIAVTRAVTIDGLRAKAAVYLLIQTYELSISIAQDLIDLIPS